MLKNMPKLEVVLIIVVITAWTGVLVPQALAQRARVPQTGQTQCWDASGNPSLCDRTGQDGDIQAGIDWPTPRFTDNRNGTVTDKLTGLIWLKDAYCFPGDLSGLMWPDALTAANTLASPSCGLSDRSVAGNWRLPNVKELQSLLDFGQTNPALPAGHPFTRVTINGVSYWSSTTIVPVPHYAAIVRMDIGLTEIDIKDATRHHVWPVRGGE